MKKIVSQPPSEEYEANFDEAFRSTQPPTKYYPLMPEVKSKSCSFADFERKNNKLFCDFLGCFINATVCTDCEDYKQGE